MEGVSLKIRVSHSNKIHIKINFRIGSSIFAATMNWTDIFNSACFHMSAKRNIIKDFFQIQEDSVSEEDQPIKVSFLTTWGQINNYLSL